MNSNTENGYSELQDQSQIHESQKPLLDVLVMPTTELASWMGGSGKAKIFWESLKVGKDPLTEEKYSSLIEHQNQGEQIEVTTPTSKNTILSEKAKLTLKNILLNRERVLPTTILNETSSSCGTRKLLIRLQDGLNVETVLIPSQKFDRTTLCVSTQVGCDRGCAFCLTGSMGLVRNLTAVEMISQVVHGIDTVARNKMPKMTNVVFMGMGDAGRNIASVSDAVYCMTDRDRLALAQGKVTISTVGPNAEIFMKIAELPATIAWSLHSSDDKIRKFLVPSTKHSTIELRDGLLTALASRKNLRSRTIMIALTLIDGINDSIEDAEKLANFIRPMLDTAPKIAIDLIPYNDINVAGFQRPSRERIIAYQGHLRKLGFFCSVRVTRGDDEYAACGMLATKRLSKTKNQ